MLLGACQDVKAMVVTEADYIKSDFVDSRDGGKATKVGKLV